MKTITMIHRGGFKRSVEVLKVTEAIIYIHWPIAGTYEVDLFTGKMIGDPESPPRRAQKNYLDWEADARDLAAARREASAA